MREPDELEAPPTHEAPPPLELGRSGRRSQSCSWRLQVEARGVLSGVRVRARSHWSSSSSSSSSVGPPRALMSTFPAISMAVVRSHIWMLPLLCPENR